LNLNDVPAVDESDLTLKKFEEYQSELQELQKEKVILVYVSNIISSSRRFENSIDFIYLTVHRQFSYIALFGRVTGCKRFLNL